MLVAWLATVPWLVRSASRSRRTVPSVGVQSGPRVGLPVLSQVPKRWGAGWLQGIVSKEPRAPDLIPLFASVCLAP